MISSTRISLALVLSAFSVGATWAQATCADSNEYSQHVMDYLVATATSTDSATIAIRQASGIPGASQADIQWVADPGVCAQAGAAYAEAEHDTVLTGGRAPQPCDSLLGKVVHVFRLADRYIVADEGNLAGEFTIAWVFDQTFATPLKRLGL